MNEVTAAFEKAVEPVGEMARGLFHPPGMRFRDDSGDMHVARGQTNDEEDVVTDQSEYRPDFDREEVTGSQEFPVCAQELFPGGARAALGRWIDAFLLQHVGDGAARGLMTEIAQSTLESGYTPKLGSRGRSGG